MPCLDQMLDEASAGFAAGKLAGRREVEQDLRLAALRVQQLQEQLRACEEALGERDQEVLALRRAIDNLSEEKQALVRDYGQAAADRAALRKLVWGAVHNAGRLLTSGRVPRWSAVADALGVGSTMAHELCRQHDLDPDELVGRGDLCGGCQHEDFIRDEICGGCVCSDNDQQVCTRADEDLGGHVCDREHCDEED